MSINSFEQSLSHLSYVKSRRTLFAGEDIQYITLKEEYAFVAESGSHISDIILLFLIICLNLLQVGWLSVCKFRLAIQCLRKHGVIV